MRFIQCGPSNGQTSATAVSAKNFLRAAAASPGTEPLCMWWSLTRLHHAHLPCKDLCTPKHNFCTLACDLGRIVLDPCIQPVLVPLRNPAWPRSSGITVIDSNRPAWWNGKLKVHHAPPHQDMKFQTNYIVTMLKTLCRSVRKLVDIDRNSHDCKCSKNP